MEFEDYIERVEKSDLFIDWKIKNPDYYLVHIFMMSGQPVQVGYYNEEEDKVASFILKDEIEMNPPEESFKKADSIPVLDVERVKIDIPEAFKKAKTLKEEKYSKEVIDKDMSILQMLEDSPIYNITFITKAFNFINIKVDAETSEILKHQINSILDLKKDETSS